MNGTATLAGRLHAAAAAATPSRTVGGAHAAAAVFKQDGRHGHRTCTPAPLCCCRAPPPPAARTAGRTAPACSLQAWGRAPPAWRGAPHSVWIEGDARPTIVPLPWASPASSCTRPPSPHPKQPNKDWKLALNFQRHVGSGQYRASQLGTQSNPCHLSSPARPGSAPPHRRPPPAAGSAHRGSCGV